MPTRDETQPRLIPIYTSRGDHGAFLSYPHLFNVTGEWIGWVTPEREVYSIYGQYVGWLSDDPRILRKRSYDYSKPNCTPPPPPQKIRPPAMVPLAPLMAEIPFSTLDVLEESPELLPTSDTGEIKTDLD
ncbi:MAG: 4-fold beta flower protein [Chloroflexota bacterium]